MEVKLAERSYPVLLGEDILPVCVAGLKEFCPEEEVFVVSDATVYRLYGDYLETLLKEEGYQPLKYLLEPGESAKTWHNAEKILDRMLAGNLGRQVPLLALGGGVVGDLAGFVAALYRRGVPFVQIPTTLLAQVDSSVGEKWRSIIRVARICWGPFTNRGRSGPICALCRPLMNANGGPDWPKY